MGDDKNKTEKLLNLSEKNKAMIQTSSKPQVVDLIGQRLKTYYEDVANEPVPDRFMDLLKQLEQSTPVKEPKKH